MSCLSPEPRYSDVVTKYLPRQRSRHDEIFQQSYESSLIYAAYLIRGLGMLYVRCEIIVDSKPDLGLAADLERLWIIILIDEYYLYRPNVISDNP